LCCARIIRKGFKKKRHNQFYTGSPHRATSSLLCTTCRESSTNSINCSHTINQPISTPRRNQYPAKLIHCSPQPPINFSRNTRLTPIAQTSQFLLPVEIRTLQIDPLLPAASNQFQQKPQANTYSPDQSISTPRRNQNPANWSTAPRRFQSISAENTGLLLKPKQYKRSINFTELQWKHLKSWFKQDQEGFRKTPWLAQKERHVHSLEETQ